MERIPINPGSVDWSGENPGMYLKETPDGPFVTLISFFRVVLSPHGRGHAAFLLLDPHGDGTASGKPNLCITDNEPLARYLRDGFATYFAAFKGAKGLAQCRFERGSQFIASGDARTTYTERFRGEGGEVSLTWEPLTDAFMVELPKEKSATGQHEMFSLFVTAGASGSLSMGKVWRATPCRATWPANRPARRSWPSRRPGCAVSRPLAVWRRTPSIARRRICGGARSDVVIPVAMRRSLSRS